MKIYSWSCWDWKLSNLNSFFIYFSSKRVCLENDIARNYCHLNTLRMQYVQYHVMGNWKMNFTFYVIYTFFHASLHQSTKICPCGWCMRWNIFTFDKYVSNGITSYRLILLSKRNYWTRFLNHSLNSELHQDSHLKICRFYEY